MSIPTLEEIRAAPTSDLLSWLLTLHEEGGISEQLLDRMETNLTAKLGREPTANEWPSDADCRAELAKIIAPILAEIDLRIPVPR